MTHVSKQIGAGRPRFLTEPQKRLTRQKETEHA